MSAGVNASDADLYTLAYSATGLPDGVSLSATTGVISDTLSASSACINNVTSPSPTAPSPT